MKSRAPRRPIALPTGSWEIRFFTPDGEGRETADTKAAARDLYFAIKKRRDVVAAELRGPDGKLWFKDHFFANDPL